jgi:endonuclease/exonuclease/phosphatase (EEP) superfamily protein YafD
MGFFITLLFLLTVLGFWGNTHWVFELMAPFRVQLMVLQGLFGLGALLRNRRQLLLLCVLGAAMNAWQVLGVYWPVHATVSGDGAPVRLVQFNLDSQNTDKPQTLATLQALKPDILAVEEMTEGWRKAVSSTAWIRQSLPYHSVSVDSQTAVFSRYPLSHMRHETVNDQFPVDGILTCRVRLPGQPIRLVVLHPQHPTSALQDWRQRRVFSYVVRHRERFDNPLLVAGDLNTSPWSHHFQAFLRQMRLQDSRQGFGIQPTWPAQWPLLGIPIDHVLVSPEVTVLNRSTGPITPSDHLPVVVDFTVN